MKMVFRNNLSIFPIYRSDAHMKKFKFNIIGPKSIFNCRREFIID